MTLIIKLFYGLVSSSCSVMLFVVLNSLQNFQLFIVFQSITEVLENLLICFDYQQWLIKENCFLLLEWVDFLYAIKTCLIPQHDIFWFLLIFPDILVSLLSLLSCRMPRGYV